MTRAANDYLISRSKKILRYHPNDFIYAFSIISQLANRIIREDAAIKLYKREEGEGQSKPSLKNFNETFVHTKRIFNMKRYLTESDLEELRTRIKKEIDLESDWNNVQCFVMPDYSLSVLTRRINEDKGLRQYNV